MNLKQHIKGTIKEMYGVWKKQKESESWRQQIVKAENKWPGRLPDLTDTEKKEIKEYWARFGINLTCFDWHRFFYTCTGLCRPDFVPKTVFNYYIKSALSELRFAPAWSDKSYLDFFVKDVNTPVNIIRNVSGNFLNSNFNFICFEEVKEIMDQYETLVIKPSIYTNTGKGVALIKRPYGFDEIFNSYKKDFVIQLPFRQHSDMAKLNASSVNTIRMNTVILNGESYIMSCFVKVGEAGQFADNSGHNRFFIGIKLQEGVFFDYAINHDLVVFKEIPSRFFFAGQQVPSLQKACQMVCKAHKQLPHFGLAFWDVCILENGEPGIVEVNLTAPDSAIAQAACGPFFGDYSDQVFSIVKTTRFGNF